MNVVNTDCAPALSDSNRRLNILFIHETLPRPDCCGSDVRLMQVLRELREQGHALTYLGRSGKDRERYSQDLERRGVPGVNARLLWTGKFRRASYLHAS
jgi:hypothetical protein